ncbi:VOC family protein [Pseudactinotalea suaedae]|uniref:VOC family protein n=1 Tax=Pseudactinotalea suaedae TaxID=1524924 RepID=UPI0012E20FEF|nr:VOC family protein [Pseudactinotalea suaedae]
MPHGDITHVEIPVTDTARATAFYGALFGWSIEELPGFEGYPMWRAPNQISGGALIQRDEALTQPRSYVEVDSIDEALARVADNGGEIVDPKTPISETSWSASFRDPDGNHIGIYETTASGSGG